MSLLKGTETAHELIAAAIATPMFFKIVGERLETLTVRDDDPAIALLLQAHEAHRVEPWLVAYLIGCMRHRAGYAVVLEILKAADRAASDRAGVVMAQLLGEEARTDLETILLHGTTLDAREGAAHGLLQLGGQTTTERIVDAINRGLLDPKIASALSTQRVDDSVMLGWFASDQAQQRQAAHHLVDYLVRLPDRSTRLSNAVATAALQAIDQQRVNARPRARHRLSEFLRV